MVVQRPTACLHLCFYLHLIMCASIEVGRRALAKPK